jgi:hypothetical protein
LRDEFGAALRPQPIERRRHLNPVASVEARTPADAKDPFGEQQRFARLPDAGDVARVEYELFRGRVYRVRWQFVERFERPLMTALVAHLTPKLGKPYYDQLIEGKFGSGRATLRRAAWRRGPRSLEIRQLNPLIGGPVFLTLSDQAAIQAIVASGGTAAPEPDSIGRWWQEPIEPSPPLTVVERDALLVALDAVLTRVDWLD